MVPALIYYPWCSLVLIVPASFMIKWFSHDKNSYNVILLHRGFHISQSLGRRTENIQTQSRKSWKIETNLSVESEKLPQTVSPITSDNSSRLRCRICRCMDCRKSNYFPGNKSWSPLDFVRKNIKEHYLTPHLLCRDAHKRVNTGWLKGREKYLPKRFFEPS